jgi:hypothetical protein
VRPQDIEAAFPLLAQHGFGITSPGSRHYNCIAWAARDTRRWWWPDPAYFWPPGVPRQLTLASFMQAYASLGFLTCQDGSLEPGFEKIAIFVDNLGSPKHAARQLPLGKWTSKLGKHEDIKHHLEGLTGLQYGHVAQFMKRPQASPVLRAISWLAHLWLRWTTFLAFLRPIGPQVLSREVVYMEVGKT